MTKRGEGKSRAQTAREQKANKAKLGLRQMNIFVHEDDRGPVRRYNLQLQRIRAELERGPEPTDNDGIFVL